MTPVRRPTAGKKTRTRRPARRAAKREIPNKASIIATDTLTMPGGKRYTILETDQTDPYDPPLPPRARRRGG